MKLSAKQVRKLLKLVALAVMATILIGCGGGTTGTSPETTRIAVNGSVEDQDGNPVSGMQLTSVTDGAIVTTDEKGHFEFVTEPANESEVHVVLKINQAESHTVVIPFEAGDSTVVTVLRVSVSGNSIELVKVQVTELNSLSPGSDPTQEPNEEQLQNSNGGQAGQSSNLPSPSATPISEAVESDRPVGSELQIVLQDDSGNPYSGATIRVPVLSGKSLSTDSNGRASLQSRKSPSSLQVFVEIAKFNYQGVLDLSGLPKSPYRVTMTLRLPKFQDGRQFRLPIQLLKYRIKKL